MAEREELDLVVNLVDNASSEADRIANKMTRLQNESVRAGSNLFGTTANLAGGGANTQAQFAQAMRNQQNYISQYETRLIGRIEAVARELREGGNRQLRGADYWRNEIQRHQGMLGRAADDAARDIIQRRIDNAIRGLRTTSGAGGPILGGRSLLPPMPPAAPGGGGGGGPSTSVPSVTPRAPYVSPWTAPPPPPPPPGPRTSVPSVGRPGFAPTPWGTPPGPQPPQPPHPVPDEGGGRWALGMERGIRAFVNLRAFGVNPTLAGIGALTSGMRGVVQAGGPLLGMVGAIGVAAFAAHKSMKAFGEEMKGWSQLQKQTGMEIGFMKNFTDQFERMGFGADKVKESLSNFAKNYRDLQRDPTFKHKILEGVQEDQKEQYGAFLDSLIGLNEEEAAAKIVEQAQRIRVNATKKFGAVIGAQAERAFLRPMGMEALAGSQGAIIPTTKEQLELQKQLAEQAERYNRAVISTSQNFGRIGTAIGSILASNFTMFWESAARQAGRLADALERIALKQKEAEDRRIAGLGKKAQEDPEGRDLSYFDMIFGTNVWGAQTNKQAYEEWLKTQPPGTGGATRLFGGGIPAGRDLAGEAGIGDLGGGGGRGWENVPQSSNIEDRRNEAVRLLSDETGEQTKATEELTGQIRTLNDFYTRLYAGDQGVGGGGITFRPGISTGGAGDAGGGTTSTGSGTTFRPGIRAPGAFPGGQTGSAPGGPAGGTRADRNNNPGNIKFGPFAKAQGATGADAQGFAIFPDRETGHKAVETLLGGKRYAGKTLAEIGQTYAEGDPNWAKNVSKATGIPLDAIPNAEQRADIARKGVMAAEGSRLGQPTTATAGDNGPPPGDVIGKAREIAQLGPRELSDFMARSGYPQSDQWCGDFAATAVKAAGGTVPKGWRLASNWRNVGPEVSAEDARPGDIAVARPGWSRRGSGQTGDIGSHVTVLDRMAGNQFYGTGGNQGGGGRATTKPFSTNRFQFYRPGGMDPQRRVPPPVGSTAAPIKAAPFKGGAVPFPGVGAGWGTRTATGEDYAGPPPFSGVKERSNIKIIDAPEGPGGGSVSVTDADAAPSLNAGKWWKGTPAGAPIQLPSSTTNTSSPRLRDQPSDEPGAHLRPVRIGDARAAMDRAQSNAMTVRGEGRIRVYNELTNGNKMQAEGKGPLFSKVTVHRDVQMPETGTGAASEM